MKTIILDNYKTALEYSEDKSTLKKVINDIKIIAEISEPTKSRWDDDRHCVPMKIEIKRGSQTIRFDFFDSHHNACLVNPDLMTLSDKVKFLKSKKSDIQPHSISFSSFAKHRLKDELKKFYDDLSYSILCTVKSEGGGQYESFNDFCDCLDYDNDSIKARDTFIAILEMQSKCKSIFSIEEMESMPS